MTTDPVSTVRAFMAAMEALDYDTAMMHVADDVEYTNMPMGPTGTLRGPAGIRAVLEPFFAPTLENEWVIKSVAVSGNTVFMERLDRHRMAKGWAENGSSTALMPAGPRSVPVGPMGMFVYSTSSAT